MAIVLLRLVCPLIIARELWLTPRSRLKKATSSLLALPLSGAAAIFTRSMPSLKPTTSFLVALGETLSEILASLPTTYRMCALNY